MRLIVLGSSGTYPGLGRACSGFLVIEKDTRLLLDCGTGVLANLQAHLPIGGLTEIIISHMHVDHFVDLMPLRYALVYGSLPRQEPLRVNLPPGGKRVWEQMVAPLAEPGRSFSVPFELSEYQDGSSYQVGDLSVRPVRLEHYIPSYGIEVRAKGRLVYSADTRPCPELVDLARGADLFVCEATWLKDEAPLHERGHLTAKEAGEVAREAGVRRLLLTHISPDVEAGKSLEQARVAFGGEASLALEGETYTVDAE